MATDNLFNESWYLRNNPDIAAAVEAGLIDAYTHFQNYGRFEGRSPGPSFDPNHYLVNNPDVAAAVEAGLITAYDHFVNHGVDEERGFVPYFDAAFYLQRNPDIAEAVEQGLITATEHFLMYGQGEPRPISPFFDLAAYTQANPDVAAAVDAGHMNALDHLLSHGFSEGRDLGNGVNLGQFQNDAVFQQAMSEGGNPFDALARVAEVTPFLPSFQPPADWTPPADTPIPVDFVPVEGEKLVIPPTVEVPDDVELPDTFEPVEPVPEPEPEPNPPTTFTVTSDDAGNLVFGGTATGAVTFVASPDGGVFERGGVSASYTFADDEKAILLDVADNGVIDQAGNGPKVVDTTFTDTLATVQSGLQHNTIFVGADGSADDPWVVTKGGLKIVLDSEVMLTGGFDVNIAGDGDVQFFGGTIAGGISKNAVAGEHAIYVRSATDVFVAGVAFQSKIGDERDGQARAIEVQDGIAANVYVNDADFIGWVTGIYVGRASELSVSTSRFESNVSGIGTDGPDKLEVTDSEFTENGENIGFTPKKVIGEVHISGNNVLGSINGTNVLVGTEHDDNLRGVAENHTLFALDGNDYVQANVGPNSGQDILVGGDGADWLRGGSGSSADSDGADIIFAGSQTELDQNTGRYAESQDWIGGGVSPKWFATDTYRLWVEQIADARGANILEGNGGDDILVASNAKDVFLYKLTDVDPETSVGTDTIHNFHVGVDKIAVITAINQGADYTIVSGESQSQSNTQVHVKASESGWGLTNGESEGDYILSFTPVDDFDGSQPAGAFSINLVGVQGSDFTVDDFFLDSGVPV